MAREKGYIVTVKVFIPVDPKNLADTSAKATALLNAQKGGSLTDLAALGAEIMTVDQRFTSREKAAKEAAEGPDEAGAGEEQPDAGASGAEADGAGEEAPAGYTETRTRRRA